jgi:hypothetical protein
VRPKSKGFGNPFQISPTPTKKKKTQNQHHKQGAQSKSGFVPKINEKNGEKWVDLVMLGFGFFVRKMGNGGKWGPAVGGERPTVVSREWGR